MRVACISFVPLLSSAPLVAHGYPTAYDQPMTDCEIMALAGRDARSHCSRDLSSKQDSAGRPGSCR